MSTDVGTEPIPHPGHAMREVTDLSNRARSIVSDIPRGFACDVEVSKEGRWFTLSGRVGTQHEKSALFELVPEIDGARWIVDRLHVGPPARR